MSTKSGYRASSGSLTSPSPSPPPDPPSKKLPSTAKAAGLDSSSELSELTEDEQDASRASTHSNTPNEDIRRVARRKRSGIVPEPMWDWAYKANGRKSNESDEATSAASKNSNPNVSHALDVVARKDNDEDEGDEPRESAMDGRLSDVDGDNDNADDDESDDSRDPDNPADADAEPENADTSTKPSLVVVPMVKKDDARESSAALTEEDPADLAAATPRSDYSMESEDDDDPREQEDEVTGDAVDEVDDEEDDEEPAKNADTAPVVPAAPSGSSIMAGQQLIKSPTTTPSTSPEPDEEAVEEPVSTMSEKPVKAEPVEPETVAAPSRDEDGAEIADQPDNEVGRDVEPEVEAEEAELELQPAHRAEALDVLAQIELRFALVREALYVEKMEDLAREEALILQGLHPEMLHLQNELQTRHDRRLELAAKKRKCEDDHVSLMRKVEEDAIWSWWKYEKDDLQTEMFTESSRKRRRLEREKRALDRPQISRPIPQGPVGRVSTKPLTAHDLVKYATLDATQDRAKSSRKRGEAFDQDYTYPSLSVLSTQEIQNDLQLLTVPRSRPYHAPVMGEIGPGIGMAPPFEQHYMDYNAPQGMGPPGHGHGPPFIPPPIGVHHPYGPPPPVRVYHQPPGPPPPMGSIHHPGPRTMQGPGGPPPMSQYHSHNTRQLRRSPSPPRMQGYEPGGAMNGGPPYGASSGSGQQWAQVPPGASPNGIPGPSKQPVVNGYGKEQRRDGRERDTRVERDREKERLWHENNAKEVQAQDEYARLHAPHLHRNPHAHQQLQGVPHHHHIVHRHNPHHHHQPGRASSQHSARAHELEDDSPSRHPPPAIEQINLLSKHIPSSPYWKQEEDRERERERERDRERGRPGPPPMSQLGPLPPERDRPQTTPFVMTPTQAMQAVFNGPRPDTRDREPPRRDPWTDDRSRYDPPDGFGHLPHSDGSSRRSHAGHSRQGSSNTLGSPRMRNGTVIPPQTPPPPPSVPLPPSGPGMGPAPPPVFTPGLLHSPSRLSGSLHASPHASGGVSTPKGVTTRPISPLAVSSKPLPSVFPIAGPGTPGSGSRLGTPGLAGPGTRPDGPLNGHGLGLTHGPGLHPPGSGLAGPAQPLIPPAGSEQSHIAPPKMTPVHAGNGS